MMDVLEPVFTVRNMKPRALAFVDYEHWLISLDHQYHLKPNIGSWISELRSKVELRDLYFFGDFSSPEMEQELFRIRSFTTKIIETKNAGIYKKDFTDFIMNTSHVVGQLSRTDWTVPSLELDNCVGEIGHP